ncbi:hypothetical protein BH18ACT11_BH18ACT11_00250 [soil metagenome]
MSGNTFLMLVILTLALLFAILSLGPLLSSL